MLNRKICQKVGIGEAPTTATRITKSAELFALRLLARNINYHISAQAANCVNFMNVEVRDMFSQTDGAFFYSI